MIIGIIYNHLKPNAQQYCDKISDWLKTKNIKVKNISYTLGGDGTMLRISRLVSKYSIPVMGVNMGTLGFLTDTDIKNVFNSLENILSNGIEYEERMMLDIEIATKNGTVKTTALNDCVIRSIYNGRLTSIDSFINKKFLSSYKGDGIVISTPTGSTAYSLAYYISDISAHINTQTYDFGL